MSKTSKERLASLETGMEDVKTDIKDFKTDIKNLKEAVEKGFGKVNKKLDDNFVTKIEFLPVKNIAFGMVGLILSIVATAIIASVVKAKLI